MKGSNHCPQRQQPKDITAGHRKSDNLGAMNKSSVWLEVSPSGVMSVHFTVPLPSRHTHELDGMINPIVPPILPFEGCESGGDCNVGGDYDGVAPSLFPKESAATLYNLV